MNNRFLLDTNIVAGILRGKIRQKPHDVNIELFINSVVLGELLHGAYFSPRISENLSLVFEFIKHIPVIPCTYDTATRYGYEKARLERVGKVIPANDLWIAATALQHNLTLVTNDKHFDLIDHLTKERW